MDDVEQAKKDIAELFRKFLEHPEDESVQSKAISLEKKYAGLSSVSDHMGEANIPESLQNAISLLQNIYEYDDGTYDDEKSINDIRIVLKKIS